MAAERGLLGWSRASRSNSALSDERLHLDGTPLAQDDAAAAAWVAQDEIFAGALLMSANEARVLRLALARQEG